MDLAPENRLRLCLWLSILFNLLIQLKFNGNHYNHFLENTLNSFVHLTVLYICLALLWPCEIQLSSSSMSAPVKYSGRIAGNLIDWSQFNFMEVLMPSNNLMRYPWSFFLPLFSLQIEEKGCRVTIPALPHQVKKRGAALWVHAYCTLAPLPSILSLPIPCHFTLQSTALLSNPQNLFRKPSGQVTLVANRDL